MHFTVGFTNSQTIKDPSYYGEPRKEVCPSPESLYLIALIFNFSTAFEIKRSVPASLDGTLEKNYYVSSNIISPGYHSELIFIKDGIPGTPSFTIDDDAGVTVTEIGNAFQQRLAKEGFTSNTISSSAYVYHGVRILCQTCIRLT